MEIRIVIGDRPMKLVRQAKRVDSHVEARV